MLPWNRNLAHKSAVNALQVVQSTNWKADIFVASCPRNAMLEDYGGPAICARGSVVADFCFRASEVWDFGDRDGDGDCMPTAAVAACMAFLEPVAQAAFCHEPFVMVAVSTPRSSLHVFASEVAEFVVNCGAAVLVVIAEVSGVLPDAGKCAHEVCEEARGMLTQPGVVQYADTLRAVVTFALPGGGHVFAAGKPKQYRGSNTACCFKLHSACGRRVD